MPQVASRISDVFVQDRIISNQSCLIGYGSCMEAPLRYFLKSCRVGFIKIKKLLKKIDLLIKKILCRREA